MSGLFFPARSLYYGRRSAKITGHDELTEPRDPTPVTSREGPRNGPGPAPLSARETPARRVAVVVNGRAKNVTAEVISTLDRILEGSDLFVSRRIEDAREIAQTLVHRQYDTVLTGGGDGTFTVMVTEVVREARKRGD